LKLKFYGSRGSTPWFSKKNIKYGSNTSCLRIDTGKNIIIIDCGSGLIQFAADMIESNAWNKNSENHPQSVDILISHLHLDHIIGLAVFQPVWEKNNNIRIFTKSRDERPLADQVFGLYQPPYWPVNLVEMNHAQMVTIQGEDSFMLGEGVKVTTMSACHPDTTMSFRIDAENKSIVHLLDCEIDENFNGEDKLLKLCKDADLVVFDGAYMPDDYPTKQGWGHSHYKMGIKLAELSGCKRVIFAHLAYDYTDETLQSFSRRDELCELGESGKYCFAYDGLEVEL